MTMRSTSSTSIVPSREVSMFVLLLVVALVVVAVGPGSVDTTSRCVNEWTKMNGIYNSFWMT